MRFIKIYLFSTLFASGIFAQTDFAKLIDDFQHNKNNDTVKAEQLNQISQYYLTKRSDSVIYYAEKAIALSEEINYKNGIAQALYNMGNFYNGAGNFDLSINYFLKSLKQFESLKNNKSVCNVLNSIGNSYAGLGETLNAIKYYKLSNNLAKQIGFGKMIAVSGVGIGNYYLENDSAQIALNYFTEANTFLKLNSPNSYNLGGSYLLLADANIKLQNYVAAAKNVTESMVIFKKINSTYGLACAYSATGNLEVKQKQYQSAIKNLLESIRLFKLTDAYTDLKITAKLLSETYEQIGENANALEYFKLHAQFKDSILNREANQQILDVATKYETEKKEQHNALLLAQNKLANQTIKQQKFTFYIIVTSLIIVIFLAFIIFRGLIKQRKANKIILFQKQEVELQKQIVENAKQEILDSIKYAKRIQDALLPTDLKIRKIIANDIIN